ncbi:MAG: hypothetical protein M0Z53_06495 [Thermaerobacter sp.]|nr:hypothetical protein [Thermaerobacter sp.]
MAEPAVRLLVFPGVHNLPLWLMQDLGVLPMSIAYTTGRDALFEDLGQDRADITFAAPDNFLMDDAVGWEPFLNATVGPLRLMASPRWPASRRVAVDNPRSGYAVLGYHYLNQHGFPPPTYTCRGFGGTPARLQALASGEADLAVLAEPYTTWARQQGLWEVGRVDTGFPTLVGACPQGLAGTKALHRFIEGYRTALAWLRQDTGFGKTAQTLLRHGLDRDLSARLAPVMGAECLRQPTTIDPAAIHRLATLTSRYGGLIRDG